jgi:hypothetical protein
MNYQKLRRRYPGFVYDKYEYRTGGNNLEINFCYSIPPDHKFTHKIIIENCKLKIENLDNIVFHIGLSLMPSYWKTTCSPEIEVRAGGLSASQAEWWNKLFIKGMGEYFYKNQIDFTANNFLRMTKGGDTRSPAFLTQVRAREHLHAAGSKKSATRIDHSQQILVPIGGGKDSIVTLELLKPHYQVVPFVINSVPLINEVINSTGLTNPMMFKSEIDPYLLQLNRQGYLNGHVPVSAFYSFASLLAAYLTGSSYIAFSNERSSNEGNTAYLGHEINHQYSKTPEFESDLNKYLLKYLKLKIKNFSFLRPLYELQITKLFCHYPQYFGVFSSCNQNFKLMPGPRSLVSKWCCHCPKCVSTALLLACFIGKGKVAEIMGIYPPDLPENKTILDELLGNSPVKPFECVLTRAEAAAAHQAIESGQADQLDRLLTSWLPNPNMPKELEQILRSHLTPLVPPS